MEASQIELEAAAIEAIARRVAQLLAGEAERWSLVDAAALAERLGVDREWVYGHAEDLGAVRLGGPHGRLRFDLETVRERLRGAAPEALGRRSPRRAPGPSRGASGLPRAGEVKSRGEVRRASAVTPARSRRQQRPGGSPDVEA